jgi:Fe-S-cluster containining protein
MISKDITAEELAVTARQSLSSYCYLECGAYCCRRGYLLLSEEEVGLMRNTNIGDLKVMPLRAEIVNDAKRYIFHLGAGGGCPNLYEYKCTIHTNPKRPKACKEFPIFVRENMTIIVTDECPGVYANLLYPYLAEFKRRGYKLIYDPVQK